MYPDNGICAVKGKIEAKASAWGEGCSLRISQFGLAAPFSPSDVHVIFRPLFAKRSDALTAYGVFTIQFD